MTTILVVDDEAELLDEITAILELEGYDVLTARNGKLALDIIQLTPPDLILCDVFMPEMNGLELLDVVEQDETLAAIPFIFLSAVASPENRQKAVEAGADAFIRKPFSIDELLRNIESLLA